MAEALELAERGRGRTHPNPPVGSVVVRDGQVVGRGFHRRVGDSHAEVVALADAGERARGADLYVTLEPCNHTGRTPPCTEAILRAGIKRVFVGSKDSNPLVSGRGLRRLREAGVVTHSGVLAAACDEANRWFARFIETGRPYVILKAAVTADGKLATATGDSKWVTGEEARASVHRLRDEVDAILVGAGTVAADDPLLTTRLSAPVIEGRTPRTPLRIVLGGRLSVSPSSRLFDTSPGPVLVFTAGGDAATEQALRARGVELVKLPGQPDDPGALDPAAVLEHLGKLGITSLLVEGGAHTHGAFLRARAADELRLFIAPRIIGAEGLSWAGPLGARLMSEAHDLVDVEVSTVGRDVLLRGRFARD